MLFRARKAPRFCQIQLQSELFSQLVEKVLCKWYEIDRFFDYSTKPPSAFSGLTMNADKTPWNNEIFNSKQTILLMPWVEPARMCKRETLACSSPERLCVVSEDGGNGAAKLKMNYGFLNLAAPGKLERLPNASQNVEKCWFRVKLCKVRGTLKTNWKCQKLSKLKFLLGVRKFENVGCLVKFWLI